MFPPFALIGKVLNKLVQDNVKRAILIIPLWRSQFWFPNVIDLLISIPVRLPRHKDLLTDPEDGTSHPLSRSMDLVTVELSTDICLRKEFLQEQSQLSLTHGNQEQKNSIVWHGVSGVFGIKNEVKIPLKPLGRR